jgi:predicted amidohydrolase YtcJ
MTNKSILATLAVFCLTTVPGFAQAPAADLVITHARVWTVDSAHPESQAVAVLGDRIVGVGTDAEITAWRGRDTKVIDAGGKLVLPGFNDSHVHFVTGGSQLDNVQLNDATSVQEFIRRIAERTKATPRGSWILGGDWDETKWTPAELPTKEMIDPVTGETPVFVGRYDGHMGVANSAAGGRHYRANARSAGRCNRPRC